MDDVCALSPYSLTLTLLTLDSLMELVSALQYSVCREWKVLGVMLKIPMVLLDAIEHDHSYNSFECLVEMLSTWLKHSAHHPPSWSTLIEAIRFLRYEPVAHELRAKYLSGLVAEEYMFLINAIVFYFFLYIILGPVSVLE